MGGGKWTRWGRGSCEGHTLDIGNLINFTIKRCLNPFGQISHYEATSHTRKIDDYSSVEDAKKAIEHDLERDMKSVLHDWDIYQRNKAKQRKP